MSTHFNTIRPTITPIDDHWRNFRIETSVTYDVGDVGSGDRIVIPGNFDTDFASIPRWFWTFYSPMGRYSPAALVHDWLYRYQTRTRKESDLIFLEAMKVLGVPYMRRKVIYRTVRMFGWAAWKANKKKLENEIS